MISIHAPILDASNLSVKASKILDWIPGSVQWLQQAINDPTLNYSFTSETALLDSIVTGLYSTTLVPVAQSGVMAAPQFLMTLSIEQLQTLALSLPQKNTQVFVELGNSAGAVTAWHNLQAETVLDKLQVSNNALFLTMNVRDISSLSQLNQTIETNAYPDFIYIEAAKFALQTACSAESFCQLTEFAILVYDFLVKKHQAKKITPAITTKFTALYDDLLSKAMQNLRCPQLLPNQSTQDIASVLQYWGQQQASLGFTDMPTALVNWVRYFSVQALLDDVGRDSLISAYRQDMIRLQQFVQVQSQFLTQDAHFWRLTISNPNPINPLAFSRSNGASNSQNGAFSTSVQASTTTGSVSQQMTGSQPPVSATQTDSLECEILVDEAGCVSLSKLYRRMPAPPVQVPETQPQAATESTKSN